MTFFEEPKGIVFQISDLCNLNCIHCFQEQCKRNDGLFFDDVVLFEKIVSDMADRGFLFLTMTGGEPLLNPKFWELLKISRKYKFFVTLKTNGTLLDEAAVEKLKENTIGTVEVSLYYPEKEVHESITGVFGSYEKSLNAIKLLKKYKIRTKMCSPLIAPLKNIEAIYQFSKELNVSWHPDPFIFSSFDKRETVEKCKLSDSETLEVIKFMLEKNIYKKEEIFVPERVGGICEIGRDGIYIGADASCYPCILSPFKLGNLREQSFDKIREKGLEFREKILKNRKCNSCDIMAYCNPCPALSLLDDGDYTACSSQRFRFANMLKKIEKKEL